MSHFQIACTQIEVDIVEFHSVFKDGVIQTEKTSVFLTSGVFL